MSRICEICGKKPVAGRSYARRGLAKKKGGVGRKITGITNRRFCPNIQRVRIVDEKGTIRRRRICAKCLKTGLRKGTLGKAVRRSRPPEEVLEAPERSDVESPPSGLEPPEASEPTAEREDIGEENREQELRAEGRPPPEPGAAEDDTGGPQDE